MHKSQNLFNLIIALHISDVTITHLQEHKTIASTESGNHNTVLLPETCRAIIRLNKLCDLCV